MAATAYAALRSLMTTIAMEQTPSPLHRPFPFSAKLIEALLRRVRFMVDFLEQGWKGAQHLEPRITSLAYAAEDAIEIPIVDQIRARNAIRCGEEEGPAPLGQDLESIIHDLDLIEAEMLPLIGDKGSGIIQDVRPRGSRSTAPPQWGETKMVGFQKDKSEIIGKLTWHDYEPGLQIIPIVGMGGIGKTTLARNVFHEDCIVMHFDVRVWVTVSQEYNVNDILKGVLSSIQNQTSAGNSREHVRKSLFNRRYLVIFDDMWSADVWHEIQKDFPDNNNGSRIMVTTRLTNLAAEQSTFRHEMNCLDKENSWNLFCDTVFSQKSCPPELQGVGNKIVRSCRGLPLAIVVIGGLLAKSDITLEYWEHVVEDFNSYLYSSDDDDCSKILFLSYNHLPVHLRPCLLYLGVFPEDHKICVSQLMRLWIAEGFLKPLGDKTLEEIAEEYLKDLIDRNFIMVSSWGSRGKIQYCIIHDLLRDLCLREAQKERFFYVVMIKHLEAPVSMVYQRRVVIWEGGANTIQRCHLNDSLGSMSRVRSLIFPMRHGISDHLPPLPKGFSAFKLFRILFSLENRINRIPQVVRSLVNMRYIAFHCEPTTLSSICLLFRNLQMLHSSDWAATQFEIWNLVQLRQVKSPAITLPEPPYCVEDQHNHIVLENLQSLSTLKDFRFSEEAIKRLPNVKKLRVLYNTEASKDWSHYSAHNLQRLKKLESFSYSFYGFGPNRKEFLQSLAFPSSLRKLSLKGCRLGWGDMNVFGSLSHLEVLKLDVDSFVGPMWNPVEGEFRGLKFLKISVRDLMNWNANATHFPCLEKLSLWFCFELKEIPMDIGEIATLQLIQMDGCPVSVMKSAKIILEQQQNFGNDDLVVEVKSWYKYRSLHDSRIKNFVATSELDGYAESNNEENE